MGRVKEAAAPIFDRLAAEFKRKHKRPPSGTEESRLWGRALTLLATQVPAAGEFWLATMETSHYTWTGIGRSQEEAIVAVKKRWDKHIKRIPKADRGEALTWAEHFRIHKKSVWEYHGGHARRVAVGHGYMDHEDETDWRRLFA